MAAFARAHGVPRSTVRGWLQGHNGPRGRARKLGQFEETEILKLLLADAGLQDWKSVQNTARVQSGVQMSRRSVLRLLQKCGFVPNRAGPVGIATVKQTPWEQPKVTLRTSSIPLTGILWQIHSGRGSEGFLLTADESPEVLKKVATTIVKGLRKRRKPVLSNHRQLTELLRTALPQWNVQFEK